MNQDSYLLFGILTITVILFLWGKWRHDIVAGIALLSCVFIGLIDSKEAFMGFAHPAVITVACVLVLSRGLQSSGAVDAMTRILLPAKAGWILSLAGLVGLGALLSGFMNNVGAMALLMPVAVQLANRVNVPPGMVLMPLAFGTILGGMTTMIGTPPNLIVSGFRAQTTESGFGMFDFMPVGLGVATVGIAFIVLIGWRLVPARKKQDPSDFETGTYTTEAQVPAKAKAAGMTLREIEEILADADAQVIGLIRNEIRINAPQSGRKVIAGDILVLEADADTLAEALSSLGLKLEEAGSSREEDNKKKKSDKKKPDPEGHSKEDESPTPSDEIVLMELVARPESSIVGRSARDLQIRTRYGLNLLAVSREGSRSKARLRTMKIKPGDLLMIQGPPDAINEFASDFRCVPLASRELRIPDKKQAILASIIMAAAVGGAAFGIVPAAISFTVGVVASMMVKTVPPRAVYEAIDWPVIVLLGALIPVAGAMESTGTADLIAHFLINNIAQEHAIFALVLILIVTMFLSDLMNNTATAAVMCPIAIGTAMALGVNPDAFLMAVGIGASCAFLTPIGHQNNTLILGPGGFRFGDYWMLGLPLEIIVVAVSIPLLLIFWPL